jgi:aspartyl-tRNA(Asn)/glutamyl-tRNA(Gln) amidotransferase subunit C
MSGITLDEVYKVAKLANLPLSPEEAKVYQSQLSQILDYVSALQKIDTSNVKPTSQVTGQSDVSREDIVIEGLDVSAALSEAQSKENNFFKVKALFEND